MGKDGKRDEADTGGMLTGQEMLMRITDAYTDAATTDEQRRRIFDAVVSILSGPDGPRPGTPEPDDA
jgi:hypothetical protein